MRTNQLLTIIAIEVKLIKEEQILEIQRLLEAQMPEITYLATGEIGSEMNSIAQKIMMGRNYNSLSSYYLSENSRKINLDTRLIKGIGDISYSDFWHGMKQAFGEVFYLLDRLNTQEKVLVVTSTLTANALLLMWPYLSVGEMPFAEHSQVVLVKPDGLLCKAEFIREIL